MWLEVICKHPCRAAVRSVWTESCICLGVITPGETQTGYSCRGVCPCVDAACGTFFSVCKVSACKVAILFAVLFWRWCFAMCSADLPAPPQSLQLCLGRNEGSERTFSFLQGQAGLLGLQEQVRHKFFVWPLNFA